ncbi:unnamed protein product [Mucor hiemalis]
MTQVTIQHILQAAERIEVHRTPVLTNTTINELASQENAPIELFSNVNFFKKRALSNSEAQVMPLLC